MKYRRILLKLSGEALLGKREYGIDPEVCDYIASEIKKLSEEKCEVVIVVGGGNIFRGIAAEKHGMNRATGDYIGMLATVMNSLALSSSMNASGVENRVYSAIDMPKVCESYFRNKAARSLEKGRVVIVAAGSGNPYFTTDTAAAIRACELGCDVLIKATRVDGVYDKDPLKYEGAIKYDKIDYLKVVNDNLGVMDNTATTLCMDNKVPMLVIDMMKADNIKQAVMGKNIGTLICCD